MSTAINKIENNFYYYNSIASDENIQENQNIAENKPSQVMDNSITPSNYTNKILEKIHIANITYKDPYVQLALEIKTKLQNLVNSVTDKDIKAIVEQNYNPEKISLSLFEKLVKSNKKSIKENDINTLKQEAEAKLEEYEKIFNNNDLKKVVNSLNEKNIPVNQNTIGKVYDVLDKFNKIQDLSNSDIINVLKQNKPLTLDNVYKAKFMGSSFNNVDNTVMNELNNQIKKILESNQLQATDKNMNIAKLMISNNIPLDANNLTTVKTLLEDIKEISKETIIDKSTDNIKEDKNPSDIKLKDDSENNNLTENISEEWKEYDNWNNKIKKIDLIHIKQLIKENQVININNLLKKVNDFNKENFNENIQLTTDQQYEAIKAKLNLEEIRLRMTSEAANILAGKGYSISTKPLEEVVEKLREIEQDNYKDILENNGVEPNKQNLKEINEVFRRIDWIKQYPSSAIAKVASNEIEPTLENISNEARMERIKEEVLKNYDKLGTKPRADLGDRIEKTFNQIESILKDLKINVNERNIRAAQILARNGMEISIDNINIVKLIDTKVQLITETLHPNIVANMIKENIMPLKINIDELLEFIKYFDEEFSTSTKEQIYKSILEIQKSNTLSNDEKESLIGIYRMFSTISKSKGAAIGFLLKNGLEITLDNLFEASKYIQKTGTNRPIISEVIDEKFGFLKELKYTDDTIKEQVAKAFNKEIKAQQLQLDIDKLLKQDISNIKELLNGNKSIEQILLNKTINKSQNLDTDKLIKKIIELADMDLDTIKVFGKYKINDSIKNLHIANNLNKDPFLLVKSIQLLLKNTTNEEHKENLIKFVDNLEKSQTLNEYENNLNELKEFINKLENEYIGTYLNTKNNTTQIVKDLNDIIEYQQIIIHEDEYYQIPVMINGNLTQLNMFFAKNKNNAEKEDSSMKIYIYFNTKNLGKVQAMVHIKNENVKFSLYTKEKENLNYLKQFEKDITSALSNLPYNIESMDFSYFEGESPISEQEKATQKINNNKLSEFDITV